MCDFVASRSSGTKYVGLFTTSLHNWRGVVQGSAPHIRLHDPGDVGVGVVFWLCVANWQQFRDLIVP